MRPAANAMHARKVRAVDTVGAGDTLVGALITALAEGHRTALRLRRPLPLLCAGVQTPCHRAGAFSPARLPHDRPLLLPRWILTMKPGEPCSKVTRLLIEGERIAAIGPREALLSPYPNAVRIELPVARS